MRENRITAITKEKTDVLTEAYQYRGIANRKLEVLNWNLKLSK